MDRRTFLASSSATVAALAGGVASREARAELGYAPDTAKGLRLIDKTLRLSGPQKAALKEHGFVKSGPAFEEGLSLVGIPAGIYLVRLDLSGQAATLPLIVK